MKKLIKEFNKLNISIIIFAIFLIPNITLARMIDIPDNNTSELCLILKNNLKHKMIDAKTNGEISLLQDFLQSEGYLTSNPNGYFGLSTLKAVKRFQIANGIIANGIVGLKTREKIKNISCDQYSQNSIKSDSNVISKFNLSSSIEKIEYDKITVKYFSFIDSNKMEPNSVSVLLHCPEAEDVVGLYDGTDDMCIQKGKIRPFPLFVKDNAIKNSPILKYENTIIFKNKSGKSVKIGADLFINTGPALTNGNFIFINPTK